MKSSFSDMFAMVFTFLHFLRFYIFLQGIAFAQQIGWHPNYKQKLKEDEKDV